MAFTEPNLHSRNLKFISMLFIAYWALGLTPSDENIRLVFINYEISNPNALAWIAHTILLYFAWRFYLSSRNMIKSGVVRTFNTSLSGKNSSLIYKLLERCAKEDYEKNHQEKFKKEREEYALEKSLDLQPQVEAATIPQEFKYENGKLTLNYQAYYRETRLPGNDFRGYAIEYRWFNWLWFKAWRILVFLTGKEETPDYLIPWVLFLLALLTSLLSAIGITAKCIPW